MTPTTAARVIVLLIALVGALTTSACGSERKGSANPENAEQRRAYVACLTQNGVTMPERPEPGGERVKIDAEHPPPGVDQAAWDRARQACASLAPPRQQKNG